MKRRGNGYERQNEKNYFMERLRRGGFCACYHAVAHLPAAGHPAADASFQCGCFFQQQASSSTEGDTRLEDAKSQNSDVVAWLTVPGTEIDDPVVQAADNDYYLRRTWLGESDVWGSYFLDYECHAREVASLDKVSIIYGHSNGDSKDDKNFSQIKRWEDADFAAQNPTFTLRLTDGTLTTWQVFAASKVPVEGENAVYYLDPNPSEETYSALLNTLRAASAQSFDGVEVTSQDKILILSTCTSNDIVRYVLCAKLVA